MISQKPGATPEQPVFVSRGGKASSSNPKTGQALPPAGLDGPSLTEATDDPRAELADWMTAPRNPFFARMLVNRYWKHFMARGMVEPEDDMRVTNPASNDQLLSALAKHFVENKFDMKELVRTICRSRHQATSDLSEQNASDQTAYSRYYPKRLNAEVLLDAIDAVTGTTTAFQGMPSGTRAVQLPDSGFNSYFLTVFGRPESTLRVSASELNRPTSRRICTLVELEGSPGEVVRRKRASCKVRCWNRWLAPTRRRSMSCT
ncbi:MAG: DUF1553 domain-containing protein [Pirellulales bacterium]